VTGVQTCALPILAWRRRASATGSPGWIGAPARRSAGQPQDHRPSGCHQANALAGPGGGAGRIRGPKTHDRRGRCAVAEQSMNSWLNDVLENDPDPTESREWLESLKAVIDAEGTGRAHQLLEGMVELTRRAGAHLPFAPTTEYINTIPPHLEPK